MRACRRGPRPRARRLPPPHQAHAPSALNHGVGRHQDAVQRVQHQPVVVQPRLPRVHLDHPLRPAQPRAAARPVLVPARDGLGGEDGADGGVALPSGGAGACSWSLSLACLLVAGSLPVKPPLTLHPKGVGSRRWSFVALHVFPPSQGSKFGCVCFFRDPVHVALCISTSESVCSDRILCAVVTDPSVRVSLKQVSLGRFLTEFRTRRSTHKSQLFPERN